MADRCSFCEIRQNCSIFSQMCRLGAGEILTLRPDLISPRIHRTKQLNAANQRWRLANPEKKTAATRNWRRANRERVNKNQREYRKKQKTATQAKYQAKVNEK